MSQNKLKIFCGNANPKLAQEICDYLGEPLGAATVESFPDGETFVRIDENIRGADVFIIQSTSNPANQHLMELFIMIDAARRASAKRITAVIPFYGYARQDRKDQPRVPITSKLVANLLVSSGANRVLTVDLHAQQIQGFFDIPVDHLYASPVLFKYLKNIDTDNLTLFSPDVGGMKMASAYAGLLKVPIGFIAKRRTSAETVEAVSLVGETEGRDILLIDDMTETAGTLCAAAELLKKNGAARVMAAVSHGVLNERGYERLSSGILDQLITTNTTPVQQRKGVPITVLSVAELLGEGIRRIYDNESVTGLFDVKGF
ncbi:MAG: ribose-phosphate pyrophosphokinase [Verrucomicrobiota bacterium]|nr:ribose-phosphate pyrophosphokinase [Verrucomicrobiota bacterium]MEC8189909.1 ribose-phosphate pyrophosphokinase [Verrucomicrobiota bacterium]MEC8329945.1 ribose-phosphate pyrophosphokinase [Verrucomicrobiota bacterium]MEC8650864.1 ribose-phosphate pyrophosphokinase [Verrucomicrobiota bacterium]MEC9228397.1 ribose-phosphate pyrophosphokinase [Verrucomicrobiota bacterium]